MVEMPLMPSRWKKFILSVSLMFFHSSSNSNTTGITKTRTVLGHQETRTVRLGRPRIPLLRISEPHIKSELLPDPRSPLIFFQNFLTPLAMAPAPWKNTPPIYYYLLFFFNVIRAWRYSFRFSLMFYGFSILHNKVELIYDSH